MKTAKQSLSKDPYICKQTWPEDCFVQCGGHGLVITDEKFSINKVLEDSDAQSEVIKAMGNEESEVKHYKTAFFEAFPKDPSCFIRGEGSTVEEAELECFKKYEKIKSCDHSSIDRRGREDGYAYCTKCPYSAMLLEPLTNCEICGKPAHYATDLKNNWYCEMHYYKLNVDDVFEQPAEGERNSIFSVAGRRQSFKKGQVLRKCLSKTQLTYGLTHDQIAEIREIVEHLAIQVETKLIFQEKQSYEQMWPQFLDPLLWEVLIEKALPIWVKRQETET